MRVHESDTWLAKMNISQDHLQNLTFESIQIIQQGYESAQIYTVHWSSSSFFHNKVHLQ